MSFDLLFLLAVNSMDIADDTMAQAKRVTTALTGFAISRTKMNMYLSLLFPSLTIGKVPYPQAIV